jgi:predicted signal transduction protein with EAL and GGDEF domain
MDDFGTGQSGLKQTDRPAARLLKIDKSEFNPLMKDPTADRLLRGGVVALAAAVRVKVIAEGVETGSRPFPPGCGRGRRAGVVVEKAVTPEELGATDSRRVFLSTCGGPVIDATGQATGLGGNEQAWSPAPSTADCSDGGHSWWRLSKVVWS